MKGEDFLFHVGVKEIPGAERILELFSQQKTDFATENPLLIQDLISEADYKILHTRFLNVLFKRIYSRRWFDVKINISSGL